MSLERPKKKNKLSSTSELKVDIKGEEDDTIKICARLCRYLYNAAGVEISQEKGFRQICCSHNENEWLATHYRSTLFLAWRGTHTPRDGINDFIFNVDEPDEIKQVGSLVRGIKVQGSCYQRAKEDMKSMAKEIDDCINQALESKEIPEITRIIFCGHSLGGAIAEMGRLILQAKLTNDNNLNSIKEKETNKAIKFYTVAFSAQMSIYIPFNLDKVLSTSDLDHPETETDYRKATVKFLRDEFAPNSFNITYGTDIVPHAYSRTEYLNAFLEDIRNRGDNIIGNVELKGSSSVFTHLLQKGGDEWTHFRHVGTVIHVEGEAGDINSTEYVDKGSNENSAILNNSLKNFQPIHYVKINEKLKDDEVIYHVKNEHTKILSLLYPTNKA